MDFRGGLRRPLVEARDTTLPFPQAENSACIPAPPLPTKASGLCGVPIILAAAAVVVAAAVVGIAHQAVAAAAAEQDQQNDDPAPIPTATVITHIKYLQIY